MRPTIRRDNPQDQAFKYDPADGVSKHCENAIVPHKGRPSPAKMRAVADSGDMSDAYIDGSQMGVRDWECEWPEEFPVHVRKATTEEIRAMQERASRRRQ